MTPTIKDVAKRANTSKSTVSRYLNGVSINKKTEAAIKDAIVELNYHPNMNARRLVMDRTGEIGVVVDDIANRFYSSILKGIGQVLAEHEYSSVYFTCSQSHPKETDFLRLLYEGQVDGLIFVSFLRRHPEDIALMKAASFPLVLVGDDADSEAVPSVDVDNFRGIADVVNYLSRIGHRDIAYISGPDTQAAAKLRTAGYETAMKKLGLHVNPDWICKSDWSNEGGYSAMKQLLRTHGFTAVIASNDESAIGAMTCLQEQGYNIPRDFSMVGFDDIDVSQWVFPSLTSVRQPLVNIGATAAQFLMDQIEDPDAHAKERCLLPTDLIIRNSSAQPG